MSFRELRNFCEIMRSLGYTRLVSMENFRTPNFELVADVLDWLLHRFEPNCAVPDDISTEAHRVEFIKVVCEKVVLRTGLKLSARKLYGADGYAVKELLRLATVLYDAQRSVASMPRGEADDSDNFGISAKLADLKSARTLCSQIVESGAGLFELLQKEEHVRGDREKALQFLDGMSRNLGSNSETDVVERAVAQLLGDHSTNLEQLKQMSEEMQKDEKQLEAKIRKKRQELDRSKKRLSSLANVRPAFMEEFEMLEQELERYYEQYVGRFRNLDYLEHEVDALNREEQDRMEANARALAGMQKRLRDEEWRILRGENDDAKRKGKQRSYKKWMPPSAVAVDGSMDAEDSDGGDTEGDSDSDPPISIGGSDDSGDDGGRGGGGRGQFDHSEAQVSIGGSMSDDDILAESDVDESSDSGDMGGRGRPGGGGDFDF
jgi:clusterin-associated protein 1